MVVLIPSVVCSFKYAGFAFTRRRIHLTRRCGRARSHKRKTSFKSPEFTIDEKENEGEERSREIVVALFYWILDVSVDFSVTDENDRTSPSTPMATLALVIQTSQNNMLCSESAFQARHFRSACQRISRTVSMSMRQGEISCTSIFKYDEAELVDRQRHERKSRCFTAAVDDGVRSTFGTASSNDEREREEDACLSAEIHRVRGNYAFLCRSFVSRLCVVKITADIFGFCLQSTDKHR